MEAEERVPGITFWVESEKQEPSIQNLAIGRVVLNATINNFGLWDECVKKLDGMRVYEADDVTEEILGALRDDNRAMESTLEQRVTVEASLRAELAESRKELERLRDFVEKQGEVIRDLRAFKASVEELL